MTDQPEALFLADALDNAPYSCGCTNEAAAELRRLHAECDALRATLKTAYEMATDPSRDESEFDWAIFCEMLYRALKESK